MDSKLTSVSVAGRQLVKLQEMQSAASRSMIASLNQNESAVASTIVSLSAESIRLSKT
jgi:hypothetical protein